MRKTKIKPTQNQPKVPSLERLDVVYPDAAAADIGRREIWVSLPPDRAGETVRCFGTFTPDLERLVHWLLENRVETVAMESTGVYWIPLVELLEANHMQAYLVKARHIQHVPGRKTDVLDCQSPKGSPRGRRGAQAKRSGCNSCIGWDCSMTPSDLTPKWGSCGPTCAIGLS